MTRQIEVSSELMRFKHVNEVHFTKMIRGPMPIKRHHQDTFFK